MLSLIRPERNVFVQIDYQIFFFFLRNAEQGFFFFLSFLLFSRNK